MRNMIMKISAVIPIFLIVISTVLAEDSYNETSGDSTEVNRPGGKIGMGIWPEGYGLYMGIDHDVSQTMGTGWVATYGLGYGDTNPEGNVGVLAGIGRRF